MVLCDELYLCNSGAHDQENFYRWWFSSTESLTIGAAATFTMAGFDSRYDQHDVLTLFQVFKILLASALSSALSAWCLDSVSSFLNLISISTTISIVSMMYIIKTYVLTPCQGFWIWSWPVAMLGAGIQRRPSSCHSELQARHLRWTFSSSP